MMSICLTDVLYDPAYDDDFHLVDPDWEDDVYLVDRDGVGEEANLMLTF